MDRYLEHIRNDISQWPNALQELQGAQLKGRWSLRELLHYDKSSFPVANLVSAAQARQLVRQMDLVWQAHGIMAAFPRQLCSLDRYRLILEVWDQACVEFSGEDHLGHIKFCHQHLAICSFGSENCICGAKFKPFPQSHLGPAA